MPAADRLHALDAVRASALLLGVALHAAQPFIAGLPWVTGERPNTVIATLWYSIHMFRMPLFFLIAGFFGRMMLERRGPRGFIKDRAQRIGLVLVAGVPIIMLITGVAFVLAGLIVGQPGQALRPPASASHQGITAALNLMHLWFLYYLLMFYALALLGRALQRWIDGEGRVMRWTDNALGALIRSGAGAVVLAVPAIAYYARLAGWSPWGGLPAPFSLVPDLGALVAYGSFFSVGWLLQRQLPLLQVLERRWPFYAAGALIAWSVCRILAGAAPHWGAFLHGASLFTYVTSYLAVAWCSSFALVGVALRYLSDFSPVRRYLADASYWIYLMHIAVLVFFSQLLHPLHLAATVNYLLAITAAMAVLLLSYHTLVRFTFMGAFLNGRRHVRTAGAAAAAAT